jgi:hypothetical protein
MSWQFMLAAATVASAAVQYSAARTQAAFGQAAAAAQRMQADEQREMNRIQAAQEEVERLRRARLVSGANRAAAGASGYDPFTSGSWLTVEGENERMAAQDVANLRLMGAARDRQLELAGYGAQVQGASYRAIGSTAWLRPVGTLLAGGAAIARNW